MPICLIFHLNKLVRCHVLMPNSKFSCFSVLEKRIFKGFASYTVMMATTVNELAPYKMEYKFSSTIDVSGEHWLKQAQHCQRCYLTFIEKVKIQLRLIIWKDFVRVKCLLRYTHMYLVFAVSWIWRRKVFSPYIVMVAIFIN